MIINIRYDLLYCKCTAIKKLTDTVLTNTVSFPTSLQKWLEIKTRKSKKPPKCELCRYQYHRHKKFKVRARYEIFDQLCVYQSTYIATLTHAIAIVSL